MTYLYTQTYYGLSAGLLMLGFFVLAPQQSLQTKVYSSEIKQDLTMAARQVFGDQPFIHPDLALIYAGVENFYNIAAAETIAMFAPSVQDNLLNLASVSNFFLSFLPQKPEPIQLISQYVQKPVMLEPPVYNLIPPHLISAFVFMQQSHSSPEAVAGTSFYSYTPVNKDQQWVTLKDNSTGELFCLAIYNNEINKYQGPCRYDYH